MPATLIVLGVLTLLGAGRAAVLWPAADPIVVAHRHPDLDPDHPHLREHRRQGRRPAHAYAIDGLHPRWPDPKGA